MNSRFAREMNEATQTLIDRRAKMTAKKLSAAQVEALKALPFSMPFWGGRPFHSWPGKFTTKTVEALVRNGMISAKRGQRLDTDYSITAAGRDALAAQPTE